MIEKRLWIMNQNDLELVILYKVLGFKPLFKSTFES